MEIERYQLWAEEDMVARSGSGRGTFTSCIPGMDFYPSGSGNSERGCVIVCPGGGYKYKTMSYEGRDIALFLNDNGLDAFVLDYRLAPDTHPAPLNDALRAVEMARQLAPELGYDSGKIGIMGFSAGGHLAASAGTMWNKPENRPDAMILCYPVITMGNKYTHPDSRANLMGENINESTIGDLSCENRVSKQTPPAFIWHTVSDQSVHVENSILFASALTAKSVPYEMHLFPEGRHGLGLASDVEGACEWSGLCIKWLKRMGF
ncbi:MAG: alpha/beta hydrolase [Eubacteriales bacterium]|nr:alpha/beta hydrolase [Eubacteriales bacterium]MDD4327896.1 alpha/beta hydrolase [Eubacteriales bacterium]MDD4717221.1 alpha/beta hydrolase [Eubacteriales bacterium]NCU26920.1 alpha/beta hydrolase [Candidatus Nomurabacteria bacterium]